MRRTDTSCVWPADCVSVSTIHNIWERMRTNEWERERKQNESTMRTFCVWRPFTVCAKRNRLEDRIRKKKNNITSRFLLPVSLGAYEHPQIRIDDENHLNQCEVMQKVASTSWCNNRAEEEIKEREKICCYWKWVPDSEWDKIQQRLFYDIRTNNAIYTMCQCCSTNCARLNNRETIAIHKILGCQVEWKFRVRCSEPSFLYMRVLIAVLRRNENSSHPHIVGLFILNLSCHRQQMTNSKSCLQTRINSLDPVLVQR